MSVCSLNELGEGRVGREELFITLPVACSLLLGLTISVSVTFPAPGSSHHLLERAHPNCPGMPCPGLTQGLRAGCTGLPRPHARHWGTI